MGNKNKLQLKQISSLAKVFPDFIHCGTVQNRRPCVKGQEFSYQIAYRCNLLEYEVFPYRLQIDADPAIALTVYRVETVPSILPYFRGIRGDDNVITKKSCIFPDPLIPLEGDIVEARVEYWRSLWITVRIPEECPAGEYPIKIAFLEEDGTVAARKSFTVDVRPYVLPEARLLNGQWFHCDCIADVHHVPIFSEEHWELIREYMKVAVAHGINIIFTPLLTPPIDTQIGGERPTVQLVDIIKNGTQYQFDFTRLRRYIQLAKSFGFQNFEINQFFTQWGSEYAPKVVAKVDGETKRIFGWDTGAMSDAYIAFLGQLIPQALVVFDEENIPRRNILFHVSDEPTVPNLEAYRRAKNTLQPLIEGCTHFESLSEYDFYEQGLVQEPVVSNDHIEPFLEHNVPNLWVYYCCWQGNKVSNRLMTSPSYRNRILGVQMYKTGVRGFLAWGYNFYYTRLSKRVVDPYRETDCGAEFPSGDAFSVYPYKGGATPALRLKVFFEGLQDIRLLYLVEEKIGRTAVIETLDRLCGEPLSYTSYPRNTAFFDQLSDFIFSHLK